MEVIDRSLMCDGNDDNLNNNCTYCTWFCFPIGCMIDEAIEE